MWNHKRGKGGKRAHFADEAEEQDILAMEKIPVHEQGH
jgi:hypothetical protein